MADPEEVVFFERTRRLVLGYLSHFGIEHGGVPEEPAWSLSPHLSVWAVSSARAPGTAGWFAIAGDVPTDYVSSADAPDARSALRHFSRSWREAADCMQQGVAHPKLKIGTPADWPRLHDLLRRRAELLAEYAEDDGLWAEGLDS